MICSPDNIKRDFDIIFDFTSFAGTSEIPVQWMKYCLEMIPTDLRHRFTNAYLLNPNQVAQKYLRRLYNVSAGKALRRSLVFRSNVTSCRTNPQCDSAYDRCRIAAARIDGSPHLPEHGMSVSAFGLHELQLNQILQSSSKKSRVRGSQRSGCDKGLNSACSRISTSALHISRLPR
jgi:hypothetical protein